MKNVCVEEYYTGNIYHRSNKRKQHVSAIMMCVAERQYFRSFYWCITQVESSESESSEEEEGHDDAMGKVTAGVDDMQNEAFWELDLNPDLPS